MRCGATTSSRPPDDLHHEASADRLWRPSSATSTPMDMSLVLQEGSLRRLGPGLPALAGTCR